VIGDAPDQIDDPGVADAVHVRGSSLIRLSCERARGVTETLAETADSFEANAPETGPTSARWAGGLPFPLDDLYGPIPSTAALGSGKDVGARNIRFSWTATVSRVLGVSDEADESFEPLSRIRRLARRGGGCGRSGCRSAAACDQARHTPARDSVDLTDMQRSHQ